MLGAIDAILIIAFILFIIGFLLIGIEIITPGFSIPGSMGIISLIVGIFLISDTIKDGVITTIIILILLGIMFMTIVRLLSNGKLKSPFILKEEQHKDKGYLSSSNINYMLGKKGIATADLRPTGTGNFDGNEFDVISEGKYIIKGTKLVIYKVQGSKLIVKPED